MRIRARNQQKPFRRTKIRIAAASLRTLYHATNILKEACTMGDNRPHHLTNDEKIRIMALAIDATRLSQFPGKKPIEAYKEIVDAIGTYAPATNGN